MTTLTVQVTQAHTIVSCAANITNCPAATDSSSIAALASSFGSAAVQTVVVTDTVGVTTTVCPVTAAEGGKYRSISLFLPEELKSH